MTYPPCHWCGRRTKNADRVCPSCLYIDRHRASSPRDGLRGGYWTPRGGVQVWVNYDISRKVSQCG